MSKSPILKELIYPEFEFKFLAEVFRNFLGGRKRVHGEYYRLWGSC